MVFVRVEDSLKAFIVQGTFNLNCIGLKEASFDLYVPWSTDIFSNYFIGKKSSDLHTSEDRLVWTCTLCCSPCNTLQFDIHLYLWDYFRLQISVFYNFGQERFLCLAPTLPQDIQIEIFELASCFQSYAFNLLESNKPLPFQIVVLELS